MTEKKQTVLIVHNYYQIPGGEDTVVANEKQMLENYGHKVIFYSRNNSELKTMDKWHKLLQPISMIFNTRTYRDIKEIIKKENIDVVHIHNTLSLISPSVYYAASSLNIPIVQTIHNFRLLCPAATFYRDDHVCEDCLTKGFRRAVKYSCYRESKLQTLACVISTKIHRFTGIFRKINYICLTEFNKEKLLNLKQINERYVFIKPNFVENINGFIPGNHRLEQFVFAGRLDKLKGIDILLKAWMQMGDEAARLLICGTGPMEDWCREFIKNNNINAEILGFMPNDKTREIIANSKALILPTQWYEGFPMSIVEAYSVGTPVVCSDLGNAGSIVLEGICGYKFPHNSTHGLIQAVSKIDISIYEKTYSEYKNKYQESINYNQIIRIYKECMVNG